MIKCPRCENENLKEDYKYCPVCGLDLRTAPEVPVQEQSIDKNKFVKDLTRVLNEAFRN
ncbi:hypothetical protein [Clostridium sp.]|uniref:hypothetical protein n=1 Tax=Clostridium sp. TaxID=1506 RepID=UPI00290A591B|nr:hypothetical protein [Clostridium sp.]MDU4726360.1 hypothetical protein [Clostridium sp.]